MKYAILTFAIFAAIVFLALYALIKNMPCPFEETANNEEEIE